MFGKTRQAWYVQQWSAETDTLREGIIIKRVKEIRQKMPRIGTRKLHHLLSEVLRPHEIDIGRDKLFDLLEDHGLLVRRRKRRKAITTDSNHPFRKYPNLVRELEVSHPQQLWVSDITYISLSDGYCYLSLITDAYSRKIVGYCLYPTLKKEGPLLALEQALKGRQTSIARTIHHSDRGMQYCCDAYVSLLNENGIVISMTEKGDPYENAIAERINGILKEEFLLDSQFETCEKAQESVANAVNTYNTERPHASCNYLTPDMAHNQRGPLLKRWRKRKHKQTKTIIDE